VTATRTPRLPRTLHPGAWWLWAIGMATAASRTTDPLLLGLVLAVVGLVVSRRRTAAPWARGFHAYLLLGLVVIGIRVLFRMLLDGGTGGTVLFTLPELPLPAAAAGIRIGGPVSLEGVTAAVYDGMRLATMLACIGAANVLANPKRLLKAVPGALYEAGSAVVVALSVAGQLVESLHRVRRARRLRGSPDRGVRGATSLVVPVLEDALDRSLSLAAAMDARGYGRTGDTPHRSRATSGALLVAGLLGVCVGLYGLLDGTAPRALGVPVLLGGVAVAAVGLQVGGRHVARTVHRPDPWRGPEWGVAATGVLAAGALVWAAGADPSALHPSTSPLVWPTLPLVPTLGVLTGALAGWIAPPPAAVDRGSATSPPAGAVAGSGTPRTPEVVA
jgi:energy-coupling factor transport system permease protein